MKIDALTLEQVATYPLPGTAVPTSLQFSPDDGAVTYLHSREGSLSQQMYAFDIESAEHRQVVQPPGGGDREEELSLEEKLRRERLRMRALGVTRYAWAKETNRLLVPLSGDVYLQDGLEADLRKVAEGGDHPVLDARLSPDGSMVAFVQDAELYVVPAEGGESRQLTHGARGTGRTHGLADYIAEEEMHRFAGYWWSKDSSKLAFTEVDETHIPVYRIVHQGKDAVGDGAQEDHRYPFAGAENPRVKLGVVSVGGGDPVWMDLGDDWEYLARVCWFPDGRLTAQLQDRMQSSLRLVSLDPETGTARPLLEETTDLWINLHQSLRPLENGTGELEGGFLWASERSGFNHLSLHARSGALVRQLTQGDWLVDQVIAVDEEGERVYFLATEAGPTERHLYEVSFDGGDPRRITQVPGLHTVRIDHARKRFVDRLESLDSPPRITLRSLKDDAEMAVIHDVRDPRIDELRLTPPRLVTLQTRDGITLHGAVYEPEGAGPWPTMVNVYGGPHAQRVQNAWSLTVDLRAQYLRRRGYLVFRLDNRGSARRGLAFEGAIRNDAGNLELQDQADGVAWLAAQGLTDPARVGIYGWSYGGYMSAMALCRQPDVFKVGVSGAPVTHWDGYDTHYTERYMGTPASNPEGYRVSSVMHHVEQMRGKLLLIHGLIDENVHFRHTARLINALIRARKEYELLLFPDERHMPRRLEDRVYMEQRIVAFLDATL